MKGYLRRGVRCMLDWGHASLDEHPLDPREAIKAAAWHDLELREGSLWATNIDWTEDALEDFRAKRIAYFSPAFDADKNGRVIEYINCALTNLPATWNNQQLVAAERPSTQKDNDMTTEEKSNLDEKMEKLEEGHKNLEDSHKALEESYKKIEECNKSMEESHKSLKEEHEALKERMKALEESKKEEAEETEEEEEEEEETKESLPEDKGDDVPDEKKDGEGDGEDEGEDGEDGTVEKKKSRTSRAALNNEIIRLTKENATLRGATATKDHASLVTQAIKRGVITPAQKGWAISNPKAFAKLCKGFKGTVAVPLQPEITTGARQLTAAEVKLCRELGVSEAKYLEDIQARPLGTPAPRGRSIS
jgi:phage I-like protein